MSNCNCNTEIIRDGSSQLDRYLQALDPDYAPVDGRSTEDLLVFAKRYAAQIRFYDIPESKIEDDIDPEKLSWSEFFRRDMAVLASSVATLDINRYKVQYDTLREELEQVPAQAKYAGLYHIILDMVIQIDQWYSVAIPGNPLRNDLDLAISANLRSRIQQVIAYEEGYKLVDAKHLLQLDFSAIQNDGIWGIDAAIDADASIYEGDNLEDKLRNAALYADEIFNSFYGFMQNLVAQSGHYLQFALEQYPGHQPHMALFIAFLKLFRLAQDQMNGLTGRMLDFYYKDVLQLQPKEALPDKAHIVFELAKEVVEYSLAPNTELKAGKDNGGVEQVYATDTELVINQAKVKELKTIFIEKTPLNAGPEDKTIQTVYARPVANSADGYGAPFTAPNPKWHTFGKGALAGRRKSDTCAVIKDMDETGDVLNTTQLGFAIASPQLVLQGGNRLISWKLDGFSEIFRDKELDTYNRDTAEKDLLIVLSGEEGWLPVSRELESYDFEGFKSSLDDGVFPSWMTTSFYYHDRGGNTLYVYLPVAEKAVIPYDAKIHGGKTFVTSWPVMQVLIGPDVKIDEGRFKALRFNDLALAVRVGSRNLHSDSLMAPHFDGLKQLILQNDDGLLPAGKPFDPFTAYPVPGKSLYVGSAEVFNKPLTELSLHIKHTMDRNYPTSPVSPDGSDAADWQEIYRTSILEQKAWNQLTYDGDKLFSESTLSKDMLRDRYAMDGNAKTDRKPVSFFDKAEDKTVKGFIRLQWSEQNNTVFNAMAAAADNNQWQAKAMEFQIKEISLSYASELRNLDQEIDQFFHVYPFGAVATYTIPYIPSPPDDKHYLSNIKNAALIPGATLPSFDELDRKSAGLLVDANERLLPHFTYKSVYSNAGKEVLLKQARAKADRSYLHHAEAGVIRVTGNARRGSSGNNQYSGMIQEEGMLFIGLENARPLQTLSMLFQFAEGSAEDEDNTPPAINWSYLTNNEWRPMKGEDIISDGTYGFQTTGIMKINIPADATQNNTIITSGLHWLCASVTRDANRIPMLIDIRTQAVTVSFKDNNNHDTHFDNPLPAGSISKLSNAVAAVSKVEQPFYSFDGKHKEAGKEFYQRVSERLRHKHRAITPWDYEHLVLDRFATIYKVKCISHTDTDCLCRDTVIVSGAQDKTFTVLPDDANGGNAAVQAILAEMNSDVSLIAVIKGQGTKPEEVAAITRRAEQVKAVLVSSGVAAARLTTKVGPGAFTGNLDVVISGYAEAAREEKCCGPQIAPGHVLIVPVANLKNRNSVNPLQPKTSRRILLEIESYLKKLTSPFVKVHARNPVYEEILTSFKVKFHTGTDQGYYLRVLNDDLIHFLTPWAFDEKATFRFGQKVYASAIINFIEERPYVDFITDFEMRVCMETCCPDTDPEKRKDDKFDPASLAGCDALESLISGALSDSGAIVARPSGPRSILVSAPRHIIQPYVAPVLETACEQRKKKKTVPATRVVEEPATPVATDTVLRRADSDAVIAVKEAVTEARTEVKHDGKAKEQAEAVIKPAPDAVGKPEPEIRPELKPETKKKTSDADLEKVTPVKVAKAKKAAVKTATPAKSSKTITFKKTDK